MFNSWCGFKVIYVFYLCEGALLHINVHIAILCKDLLLVETGQLPLVSSSAVKLRSKKTECFR